MSSGEPGWSSGWADVVTAPHIRLSLGDVYSNYEDISKELTNLFSEVILSESGRIGVEFVMCLDELFP